MRNNKLNNTYLFLALLAGIAVLTEGFIKNNKAVYSTFFPTDVQGAGNVVNDILFSTWTNNANSSPNVFVLPADGPNFVGDNPTAAQPSGSANNLDFHRWAEQMYLWILSPAPSDGSYGNCGGLVLNSKQFYDFDLYNGVYRKHICPNILDPNPIQSTEKVANKTTDVTGSMTFGVKGTNKGSKNLPILIEKDTDKIFDVDKTPLNKNGFPLVYDVHKNKVEVAAIKTKKNEPIFYDVKGNIIEKPSLILSKELDENTTVQQFTFNKTTLTIATIDGASIVIMPYQNQAQTNSALMARNGSLVYYNIMVNDVAAVFSTMVNKGVANGGLPNTTKFPTTQAELDVIKAYATAHGFPLINTNNRVLAMEVKTSWVETINFTSTPPLPTAVNPPPYLGDYVTINASVPNYVQSSSTTWTLSTTNPKRIARLALVGMHVVGSVKGHPEMIWSTFEHENNAPNNEFSCNDDSGVPVFFSSDITSTNWLFCNPTASIASINNSTNIIQSGTNISATNGNTISASNIFRSKPFGWAGPANNPAALDNPEISKQGTHNARLIALKNDVDANLVSGDVRKKYFQVGATWNSKIRTNGAHVGSIILSNSTMETTTQNTHSCFTCHASEPGQANRDMPSFSPRLSHVFGNSLIP